jgi:hypothetical protein
MITNTLYLNAFKLQQAAELHQQGKSHLRTYTEAIAHHLMESPMGCG